MTAPWTLRRWQSEALPLFVDAVASGRRAIVAATMGSGKSVLLAELAHALRPRYTSTAVVVSVPTQKLVDQMWETFSRRFGAGHVGRFYQYAKDADQAVIIACNDSLPGLAEALESGWRRCETLIIDEVHKSEAEALRAVVARMAPDRMAGCTATPYRSDERERIQLFDEVVYRYTPGQALRDGVIVPWRIVNWEGHGEQPLDEAVLHLIQQHAEGPGLVDATSIDDAELFAEYLRDHGVLAEAIHSRMGRTVQRDRIAELQRGDLDCLVHVNMLAEGIDFPWLRWLAMRRPVGARVRFTQQVGRVLRSHEGKSEALLIDPHDLMGTFGLQYTEALGWIDEEAEAKAAEEAEAKRRGESIAAIRMLVEREAHTDPVSAYCRRLLLVLQAHGIVEAGKVQSPAWRRDPSTAKQASALARMSGLAGRLPVPHAEIVAELCARADILTKGAASDLFEILKASSRGLQEVEFDLADVDPLDAGAREDIGRGERAIGLDSRWYCAGVVSRKKGACAWAVVQGGRTVEALARDLTNTDHLGAVELAAVAMAARKMPPGDRLGMSSDWVARFVVRSQRPKNARIALAMQSVPAGLGVDLVDEKQNPAYRVAWSTLARWCRRAG